MIFNCTNNNNEASNEPENAVQINQIGYGMFIFYNYRLSRHNLNL